MRSPIISDVVVTLASDHVAATGLEAWCALTVHGLRMDSVTVRTTAAGELRVAMPARKAGSGVLHPILTAVDPALADAITEAVLNAYVRARGASR